MAKFTFNSKPTATPMAAPKAPMAAPKAPAPRPIAVKKVTMPKTKRVTGPFVGNLSIPSIRALTPIVGRRRKRMRY